MINQERIKSTFIELVQIDSHSRQERNVAQWIKRRCEGIGATVEIDDAGEKVGGNTGNVIARLPATIPGGSPFLLSAHMDTVPPGEGVRPVVEDGKVRSDGTTVLGGDDKSGVAVILEILHTIAEHRVPHTGIEAVFSICEEVGLLGAKHLDSTKLHARSGLVFDADEPRLLYTKGPSICDLEFRIHGLESHAGVAPEQGISAIRVAAEGIAAMRLGRIDEETTANIGIIEGGKARNVVPNHVRLHGEARSFDEAKLDRQVKHMVQCLKDAAARYEVTVDEKTVGAKVEEQIEVSYEVMNVDDDSPVVKLVKSASERLGREVRTLASGGGCDANIFNSRGIECANLGTGQRAIHTVNEWVDLNDMYAAAELALEVIKVNGELAAK